MSKTKRSLVPTTVPYGTVVASFEGNISAFRKAGGESTMKSLNAAVQKQALHILGPGPGFPIATTPYYSFLPTEILYHRLQVAGTSTYSYLSGSGIYRNASNPGDEVQPSDFDEFIAALVDGDPSDANSVVYDDPLHNFANGAPNIVVKKQCYVVVELNGPPGMRFLPGAPAIKTVYNVPHYYYDLKHIDSAGNTGGTSTPMDVPCLLFYFSVEHPYNDHVDDQFNLYLQIDSPQSVTFVAVDPYIKNRGGTPPLVIKRARKR
jgi:hypothetical protein